MRACIGTMTALVMACSFDASGSSAGDDTSNGTGGSGGSGGSGGTADSTAGTGSTAPTTAATEDATGPGTGDSGDATTGAVVYGPFDTPVPLAELNSDGTDDDPSVRGDLLEIYFASTRAGTEDLWRATRESASDPFDLPEPVDALNLVDADETTPELSFDGLAMVFSSSRPGGPGDLDMYLTTRASFDEPWATPELLEELSSQSAEGAAVFTEDGLSTLFCRGQASNGAGLFRGTRTDLRAPWEIDVLESLDTPFADCSPWISADGSELWFGSDRDDGMGDNDVWMVAMDGGQPGQPEGVAEINTGFFEDDPWLSPDGSTLVFASDRARDGDVDLYIAVRSAM